MLTVAPVNDTPVITSPAGGAQSNIQVNEGVTSVTTVTASDIDGHQISFSLSGSADAAALAIDPDTGVLTFGEPADFESAADVDADGVYEVRVTATDSLGASTSQDLSITIIDANEAPIALDQSLMLSSTSDFTGQLLATDPDANDVLSYNITGGSGIGTFAVHGVTGLISLLPDFDAFGLGEEMTLEVTVTDSGGLSTTVTITIGVEAIEEAIEIIERERTVEDTIIERFQEQEPSEEDPVELDVVGETVETASPVEGEKPGDSAPQVEQRDGEHETRVAVEDLNRQSHEVDLRTSKVVSADRGFRMILDLLFDGEEFEKSQSSQRTYALNTAHSEINIGKAAYAAIDSLKEQLENQNQSVLEDYEKAVFGSTIASVSISAGVAAWVLRAGALVTSLLGTSPMWRQFDPLPVLASDDANDEWERDELEELFHSDNADEIFDESVPIEEKT
jgi:hypothetical protein